jgi:hypothetical protein
MRFIHVSFALAIDVLDQFSSLQQLAHPAAQHAHAHVEAKGQFVQGEKFHP